MANGRGDRERRLEVAPERMAGWLAGFAGRHGALTAEPSAAGVSFRAADGAQADCEVPFPPLPAGGEQPASPVDLAAARAWGERIAAHALADRTVGVLLVRLGGYAAGVFTGPDAVLAGSKVGARLVHGRSAAGGQSQQRFARRRQKQAAEALHAAADTAAAVLGPYAGRLDAVVLGGDRRAVAGLRTDPRLAPYFALAAGRFLTVPDPRLAVLKSAPRLFRAVRITLTEPGAAAP